MRPACPPLLATDRATDVGRSVGHQTDPTQRARLRWRARRGLLENDIVLTRFLDRYEAGLSDADVGALTLLLDLADNDLLDLILARKEPSGALDDPSVHEVVELMRAA